MSLINALPYRVRTPIQIYRHNAVCRPVLDTPPIKAQEDGLILFSMIGTKILLPYLVAIKSLWAQLRRGRVVILDDGSLTMQDKILLAHHLDNPRIIPIQSVDVTDFLKGGTWERLLTILDCRPDDYVVQLDSDTVTIGPVPEVAQAIEKGASFLFAGDAQSAARGILPVADYLASYYTNAVKSADHVQNVLEQAMVQLRDSETLRYFRGCSGFAGFAPAKSGRALARDLTGQFRTIIGADKLSEWGSEQFMSNMLLANEQQQPVVLPGDRYINYWGSPWSDQVRFIHFLGTHRYTGSAYADATRAALAMIETLA